MKKTDMSKNKDDKTVKRSIEIKRVRTGIRAGQSPGECASGFCGTPQQSGGGSGSGSGSSILIAN